MNNYFSHIALKCNAHTFHDVAGTFRFEAEGANCATTRGADKEASR